MAIGKPILEKSSQGQKRSTTRILTLSDPKIRGQEPKTVSKRAHNPLLKEAGLTQVGPGQAPSPELNGEPGVRSCLAIKKPLPQVRISGWVLAHQKALSAHFSDFSQPLVRGLAGLAGRLAGPIAELTGAPGIRSAAIAAAVRVHRQVVFTILVHPAGAPAFLATEGTATIYQSNGRFVATLPVQNGQVTLNRYLCQVFQKTYYAVYNGTANLGRARSNMVRVTMSPVMAGARSTPPAIVPKVTPAAPKATLALALHANRAAVLRKR